MFRGEQYTNRSGEIVEVLQFSESAPEKWGVTVLNFSRRCQQWFSSADFAATHAALPDQSPEIVNPPMYTEQSAGLLWENE